MKKSSKIVGMLFTLGIVTFVCILALIEYRGILNDYPAVSEFEKAFAYIMAMGFNGIVVACIPITLGIIVFFDFVDEYKIEKKLALALVISAPTFLVPILCLVTRINKKRNRN